MTFKEEQQAATGMLKFLIIILNISFLVKCELTLERINAISDLSAIALKYFSLQPRMEFSSPDAKVMNAFAWSVSDMWDENESALYVLTRLANLVDERDESSGQLSMTARVIRSFAEQAGVYGSEEGRVKEEEEVKRESRTQVGSGDEELEQMYLRGEDKAADLRVTRLINIRWTSLEQAINDIETAAKQDHPNLMSAMIRLGSEHPTLKFIAPELKAGLSLRLLSLPKMKLKPETARWLLTMETYREDQQKLVRTLEKSLKNRQVEKSMRTTSNDLLQLFSDVEEIRTMAEKAMRGEATGQSGEVKGQLVEVKGQEQTKTDDSQQSQTQLQSQSQTQNQSQTQPQSQNQPQSQTQSQNQAQNQQPKQNYFEEQEKREDELDNFIATTKKDEGFDDDGVYTKEEAERDRVGQLIALILVSVIITGAIGTYLYLRMRRARRNRTMLVVNGAVEHSIPA